MATKQGDLGLLNDPVAQELLQSTIPARLAYNWTDGTPRVVPIWFHWDGKAVVLGTPTDAPKIQALQHNPAVALTIDHNQGASRVLLIRGTATVTVLDGIVPEYVAAAKRYLGEEAAQGWLAQVGMLAPQMARVAITPEWVGILDFESRFPSSIEAAMARMQAPATT